MSKISSAVLIAATLVLVSSILYVTQGASALALAIRSAIPSFASTSDQAGLSSGQRPYQVTVELPAVTSSSQPMVQQQVLRIPRGKYFVIRYVNADIPDACGAPDIVVTTVAGGHAATYHLRFLVPANSQGNCGDVAGSEPVYISADAGSSVVIAANTGNQNSSITVNLSGYLVG